MGERVARGQLLIRLEDREAHARLRKAQASAAAIRRERDADPRTGRYAKVTAAEDAVFDAKRVVARWRRELDKVIAVGRQRSYKIKSAVVTRSRLARAIDLLRRRESALNAAKAAFPEYLPNRLEADLAIARAEVTVADALVDHTRIRAPHSGTVMRINTMVGELVSPNSLKPAVLVGNESDLQVRAEVDQSDVSKLRVGQRLLMHTSAFPREYFAGRVKTMASVLHRPRIGARGVRRATDVEVMEILVDLDSRGNLRTGMRMNIFLPRESPPTLGSNGAVDRSSAGR
jgi:HlyD family secretion protein